MDKPIVSIIVPIYNAEKFLKQCLQSLVQQTYKPIEIILVNDGSTDNSIAICKQFIDKYSFITLIEQKNSGPGVARNTGLDAMHGEYYMFVDADDYVSVNIVNELVREITASKVDVVECGTVILDRFRNRVVDGNNERYILTGTNTLVEDYFSSSRKIFNSIWGRLYRTVCFKNIRFSNMSIAEDSEYSLKILSRCSMFEKYNHVLYAYRAYQESLTRTKLNNKFFEPVDVSYRDMVLVDSFCNANLDWNGIIDSFYDLCSVLISRVVRENKTEKFVAEINHMIAIEENVLKIAAKHEVYPQKSVKEMIESNTECRNNKKQTITVSPIKSLKQGCLKLLSWIKVAVKYQANLNKY